MHLTIAAIYQNLSWILIIHLLQLKMVYYLIKIWELCYIIQQKNQEPTPFQMA